MPNGIENHAVTFFTTSSAIFVAEAGFCPVIIRPDTTTLHAQSFTYKNFAPFSPVLFPKETALLPLIL